MKLTEDQVERRVEKMTDALDRQFKTGVIDQKTYDSAIKELADWADAKLGPNAVTGRR